MDYDNQLAQTGQLSDIGEALTTKHIKIIVGKVPPPDDYNPR